jgi:hypothetical protein
MLDAIKPLLESELVNEETKEAIQEAWEGQLNEAREVIRAELREEFAQRYEHDKSVMVEALDKMVTEGLATEIQEFAEEKKSLAEDRVKFQSKMNENATKFNDFMVTKLAEEITELRKDRTVQKEGFEKLEKFIIEALAREIKEFAQDKRDVVESKVKLVAEAKDKLEALQKRFVAENSAKVKNLVAKNLSTELSQLHEDIKVARENNFGRQIFEAFASEFTTTYLNENAEIRKLQDEVKARDNKLAEARNFAVKAKALVESKDREIRIIKESNERSSVMDELLSPLNDDKADTMRSLLENVQTGRLKSAYEKYLPAVLSNKAQKPQRKQVVTESKKEFTGNKTVTSKVKDSDGESNIIDLKKLAGLK